YILQHRPDEFGLVLDEDGFVSLKELQQAIAEEEGWSYVRRSHIIEAVYTGDRERFEVKDDGIRHALLHRIHYASASPPKVLYQGIRRRAYPHILQKGLDPMGKQYVCLAISPELARRIARRRDLDPIVVEIQAQKAFENGIIFYQANPLIYLANRIPPSYIIGPPIAKVLPEKKPSEKKPPEKRWPEHERELPGSVLLNLRMEPLYQEGKGKDWKDHSRRNRRSQRRV
ncbi:MAG: RNA 2'-phosphotransferase, partial [Desulfobacterales bacterium]|nr:RNA 2'-phosphotransferase [Desulfobacterales bacterium]